MPEGPEVHLFRDLLDSKVSGKKLENFRVISGRYEKGIIVGHKEFKELLPAKIISIKCKGKFLYFQFDNGYYLWSTLGLTGKWNLDRNLHSRITLEFKDFNIYYEDSRNFGTKKFVNSEYEMEKKLKSIGPDILNEKTSYYDFKIKIKKFRNQKKLISSALLDQKLVSGIGNYARADILWVAKIDPHRMLKSLSDDDLKAIFNAAKYVLMSHYKSAKSLDLGKIYPKKTELYYEKYKRQYLVYQQKTDPLDNPVKKEKIKGRTMHWVPKIQK